MLANCFDIPAKQFRHLLPVQPHVLIFHADLQADFPVLRLKYGKLILKILIRS